jgi:hypothetical protein
LCYRVDPTQNGDFGMPLDADFNPQTAVKMRAELAQFGDKCRYDEGLKRIVYDSDRSAMEAYMILQREEMQRHKWIESEKNRGDLGPQALADWVCKYSKQFARYWRRTHLFIPSSDGSTK